MKQEARWWSEQRAPSQHGAGLGSGNFLRGKAGARGVYWREREPSVMGNGLHRSTGDPRPTGECKLGSR